jgi:hypothetical protein
LGLGLRRASPAAEFRLLCPSPVFGPLCARVGIEYGLLPTETEERLGPERFESSALFEAIASWKPDVLVVDMHWFSLHAMMPALGCRTVFLTRQVHPSFFRIQTPKLSLEFRPADWDLVVACEPWDAPFPAINIDPIVIRNREEILTKDKALQALGAAGDKPVFLLSLNAHPGNFEKAKAYYRYLEGEGWEAVYTTNYDGGLFPAADCFAAVDLLACGAGYNSFWESVYFGKETVYLPQKARFEDAWERMKRGSGYEFRENGADTLARMALAL